MNIEGPDGSILFFHDVLKVTSGPGEGWVLDSTSAAGDSLYDMNMLPLDFSSPILLTEMPINTDSSMYVLDVLHKPGEAVFANFSSNFLLGASLLGQAVDVCIDDCRAAIPTLGEWGLIIMSLLLLIFGTIAVIQASRTSRLSRMSQKASGGNSIQME